MSVVKTILLTGLIILAGLVLIETMRLLMLKHSITTYRQYWDKQSAQTARPDSLLYVALGDSVAQGIGASQPANGYVGLLSAQISKAAGRPVHVINLSVTGAKIQDVIKDQLPKLQQMSLPAGSLVTVDIGSNDLGSYEPARFNSQMDELLSQLPPQTIVADLPYFGGGRSKKREPIALKANEIIQELSAKYKLRVAPVHVTTKQNDNFWVYGADFFHPSDRGYINWYQAYLSQL